MKPRTVLAMVAAGALIGLTTGRLAPAGANTVICGGQAWHVQAPVQCTKTKTIDGTAVTIYLRQDADGAETVVFTLGTPRATDTLIHVTSHLGNSDVGGPDTDPIGTIPAGQLTGMLHIPHALCGQNDIRAIFDNTTGRVSGPYILNSSCAVVPPTTTATSSPASSGPPPTTVPSSPSTTPGTAAIPVPGTINTVPAGTKLAATGNNSTNVEVWGLASLAVGGGLILATRRRAS